MTFACSRHGEARGQPLQAHVMVMTAAVRLTLWRRNNVDAISKCAEVLSFDFTPWRRGTKHRPVVCSIQVRGCWCKKASVQRKQMYNPRELEHSLTQYDDRAMQLQEKITHALADMHAGAEPDAINQIMHDVCVEIYPKSRANGGGTKNAKAWQTLNVKHTLAGMWSAYKVMRSTARTRLPMRQGLGRLFRAWREVLRSTRLSRSSKAMARKRRIGLQLTCARMFNVWKCYLQFDRSHRVFCQAGKSGRRQIMLDKLAKAEDAASPHQPGEALQNFRWGQGILRYPEEWADSKAWKGQQETAGPSISWPSRPRWQDYGTSAEE